jgi:hypothetical protein
MDTFNSIPVDPVEGSGPRGYVYYSDGKNYAAIVVRLKRARGPVAAGGPCMTGPYAKGTGAFGEPPACPF